MKPLTPSRCAHAAATLIARGKHVSICLLAICIISGCSPYNVKQIGAKRKKSYHEAPVKITTPWR